MTSLNKTHPVNKFNGILFSTCENGKKAKGEYCDVALESPLTIRVNEKDNYTVLCSPQNKRAMAVGFLFSEGLIDSVNDILLLKECEDSGEVINVNIIENEQQDQRAKRNMLIVSSCGVCGSEDLKDKIRKMPGAGDDLKLDCRILRSVSEKIRDKQEVFKNCGGTHAVGIFDETGKIISFAEDIGRHNALDKAVGKILLSGQSPRGKAAFLSGRTSLEMVSKCAAAGIELVASVSAPTSLAIDAALVSNITLIAFVREKRATVFTHEKRILGI